MKKLLIIPGILLFCSLFGQNKQTINLDQPSSISGTFTADTLSSNKLKVDIIDSKDSTDIRFIESTIMDSVLCYLADKLYFDVDKNSYFDYDVTGNRIFLGNQSGINSTGVENICIGDFSGQALTTGTKNVFLGFRSGSLTTTGTLNTGIGSYTLQQNNAGVRNIAIGYTSLQFNTTGRDNVGIGYSAGNANTTGEHNTFIGSFSGASNQTGSDNTFIGYKAGYSETNSNRLYVSNSDTVNPLIYGEFDNSFFKINADSSWATGYIRCDSILTTKAGAWADYVFDENYALNPFEQEIAWIKKNKHLRSLRPNNSSVYVSNKEIERRLEGLVEEVEKLYLYIEQLKGE